ncbi:PREDICTED: gamma-tubulin complex component 4-like, partial [Amphimedon queenslandica]|uniref:Gamma tubulin complex component protein N-terminal domain-containing protein n=2 Tax=Amphimedon queenslandica TaxID=400682 RepID=A0AAN0K1X7_AMPQE
MHHEILLTLSGCPGDVFMTSRETGHYEIIPDIPYIHPSEVSLINGLVSLGSYYKFLIDFVSKQTSAIVNLATPPDSEENQLGLYLRALGFGINNVLEPYRMRLVEVEQECIADPHLPLSHIKHRFEQVHNT